MLKLVLAKSVPAELEEISQYIAHDHAGAALRFLEAARDAFERLAIFPGMGRERDFPGAGFAGLRSWRVAGFESYLVFYRVVQEEVRILHVCDGARNIEALFTKR